MAKIERVKNHEGRTVLAEINPTTGDPQVFPYREADSNTLRLAQQHPGNTHLQELAQSVRDHRAGFRAGHTLNCRGDLCRGLCH